jgi:hypothetical protein
LAEIFSLLSDSACGGYRGSNRAAARANSSWRAPSRLAQQQNPAVAGHLAARKLSLNTPLAAGWKIETQ